MTQRVRSKIFRAYLSQDIAWFDDPTHNPGSLCLQLSSEASAIQKVRISFYYNNLAFVISIIQTTGIYIGTLLEAFGNLGIGTILSLYYGWELTLVMIGFLPFIILAGVLNVKLIDKFSKKDFQSLKEASKVCHIVNTINAYSFDFQLSMETFKNIRTVQQLTKENYFINCYETLLLKPHRFVKFF